jgi:hypothetical protein
MGAGRRGGHDRHGRDTGEGPGGFQEEEVPEALPLLREGRGKEGGVLRDERGMVGPADLDLQVFQAGRGRRMRREAGEDLPAEIELIHGLLFGGNASSCRLRAHFHHRRAAGPDVGYDLIPEGEDGPLVEDLVLVDVDR